MLVSFLHNSAAYPGIEHFHEREAEVSLGDQVNTAAVVLFFVGSNGPLRRLIEKVDHLLIDRQNDAGTFCFQVQLARHRQRGIANLFRLKPPAAEAPESLLSGSFSIAVEASGEVPAWR